MKCDRGSDCFKPMSCAGFELRLLTKEEIWDKYLPLRFDIFHREFGYDHGTISTPKGFYDTFDDHSLHYGIFNSQQNLVAAARLVISQDSHSLPSSIFLRNHLAGLTRDQSCAEISRVVVRKEFRGNGLFTVLFYTAMALCCLEQIRFVLISEMEEKNFENFLTRHHFKKARSDYWFTDEKIAPTVKTASYIGYAKEEQTHYMDLAQNALVCAMDKIV